MRRTGSATGIEHALLSPPSPSFSTSNSGGVYPTHTTRIDGWRLTLYDLRPAQRMPIGTATVVPMPKLRTVGSCKRPVVPLPKLTGTVFKSINFE